MDLLSIKKTAEAIDQKQLEMGKKVELEHRDVTGGDPEMTEQIARAHLREDPKYYTHLKEMEDKHAKQAAYDEGVATALRQVGLLR